MYLYIDETNTDWLIVSTRNEFNEVFPVSGWQLSFSTAACSRGADERRKTGCIDWYAQAKVQDYIESCWRLESNASVQHNKWSVGKQV